VTLAPGFATPFSRAFTLGVQREVSRNFVISLDLYHKGIENLLGVRQTNLPFDARLLNNFVGPYVNGYGHGTQASSTPRLSPSRNGIAITSPPAAAMH